MLESLRANVRFALSVRSFLKRTVGEQEATAQIRTRAASRDETFLKLMELTVYGNPTSPYLALLNRAGITLDDLRRLVAEVGLEDALEHLYQEGVYVTSSEFKGRQPIRREGFELKVTQADFDNPLLTTAMYGTSSGSRGAPARTRIDLEHMGSEAAYMALGLPGFQQRPLACWGSGLERVAIRYAKAGKKLSRHFSTLPRKPGIGPWAAAQVARIVSNLSGFHVPPVEYVSRDDAWKIAAWLADQKARGTPAIVSAFATPAVRICGAAKERGLDIAGTWFVVVGEPYTPAKAEIVESVGARALTGYAMSEMGYVGRGCESPAEVDEVHVFNDKLAVIDKDRETMSGDVVPSLFFTSAELKAPKIALNMESGDYGHLSQRSCGCPLEKLGFNLHLSGIRSYEKLTSESVTFSATEILELLEEVLPAKFGGQIADFQLVEEEVEGMPKVSLVVAPSVGEVDEGALVATVLDTLKRSEGPDGWSDLWREAGTLRVVRRDPYESRAKVQPLHMLRH